MSTVRVVQYLSRGTCIPDNVNEGLQRLLDDGWKIVTHAIALVDVGDITASHYYTLIKD